MTIRDRRRALIGAQKSGGTRLPAEYQEVEWVGVRNNNTTVTAYMNAGNVINNGDKLHVEMKPFSIIGQYDSPLGGTGSDKGWELYYVSSGNSLLLYTNLMSASLLSYAISTWDTAIISFASSALLRILAYDPYKKYAFSGKIKSLWIEDSGGTTTHNYVPCYRKSDSVIGMYDLNTDTFLINVGKGTLLKGDDVA